MLTWHYERHAIVNRLRDVRDQVGGLQTRETRCYMSGPMTGIPNFNKMGFELGAGYLRDAGWFVYCPTENDAEAGIVLEGKQGDESFDFAEAMKRDLWQVCDSDAVFVLPGWEYSKGALLEVHVAHEVGVPVYTLYDARRIEAPAVSPHAHPFSSVALSEEPNEGWIELAQAEQNEYERLVAEGEIKLAPSKMLSFETGATRNRKEEELAYEGFLSPLAVRMYAEYMHEHRHTADGGLRAPDNWQKGIPLDSFMDSLWRHVMDLWMIHRGFPELAREGLREALSGIFFNTQGYMHETYKAELADRRAA